MADLKHYIRKRLEENVPLRQIKGELAKGGYKMEDINRASRAVIAGMNHKTSNKTLAIVIAVVIIVTIVYYTMYSTNPAVTGSTTQQLCDKFKGAEYAISCDEAVALALADKPGNIQDISIGTRRTPTESEGKILMKDTKLWLIDIRLDEPFYDEKLNKEIKLLRVGIGTDEHFGMYREIIK